jgi:hypothetical protein
MCRKDKLDQLGPPAGLFFEPAHLQRFPASGLFEVRGFKTLWDAFCYKAQNGPFDDPIVSENTKA